jgi:predicted amidohydrolase YtcJ
VLLNRGNHLGIANSAALARAGITDATPDPAGGRIGRDASGKANGILYEAPAFELVSRLIPAPTREERKDAIREIQPLYHAAGICGVIEPGLNNEDLSIYQELWHENELTVRTVAMPLAQTSDDPDTLLASLSAWGVHTGFGDARLKLGGVKLFVDGGATLGTALMRKPYPDERCNCGIQVTHTTTFHRIAQLCAQRGWSLGVHAVGGGAIDLALEIFKDVDRTFPIRDLRFSLIHAYLWPSDDNIETAKRLGVVVATQPAMQYNFAPILVKRFGADAFGRATPIRSWLDGGVVVGGGSDSPVNPYEPLLGIWHAVTRYVDVLHEPVGKGEAISVEEALAMYTRDAAWLSFSEHERGVLRQGLLADWVVLSEDPGRCTPEALRDISVLATSVGGTIVHSTLQPQLYE